MSAAAADTGSDDAPRTVLRGRVLAFVAVLTVCIAVAAGYAAYAAWRADAAAAAPGTLPAARLDALPLGGAAPLTATAPLPATRAQPGADGRPYVLFRSTALGETHGRVGLQPLDAAGGPRFVTSLHCDRVHFAAGRGVCLQARRGVLTSYHALVFDRNLAVQHSVALAGAPSRARMSADGRLAAMTVFVSGHSYMSANFSTRTSILDTASGQMVVDDLEKFTVLREGAAFKAADFNFWGVTFARDGQRFYATLATAGKLYLVEGDVGARSMRVIHDDVECPSLSPDGSRVAFKRRVPAGAPGRLMWRLHVLELASGKVTPLTAETRNVDDQVEWLGDREIVYALPEDAASATAATNIWALTTDGSSAPRLLVPLAFSPAVVQ